MEPLVSELLLVIVLPNVQNISMQNRNALLQLTLSNYIHGNIFLVKYFYGLTNALRYKVAAYFLIILHIIHKRM
jgi:hypothetical protein